MSRRDFACGVVEEWCGSLGLSGLKADEVGRLSLTFNELAVTFVHRQQPVETVSIYVDLGTVHEGVAALLLEINLQTWLRGVMTVGLNRDNGRAIGWTGIPVAQLSVSTLAQLVEGLLTAALPVRDLLNDPDIAGSIQSSAMATPRFHDPGIIRV